MTTVMRALTYRTDDGHVYRAFPEYEGSATKPDLKWVQLYSMKSEFKGTWFREEMPPHVIQWFETQIKRWFKDENLPRW